MKIQPRQIDQFIAAPPPALTAALIYGPDNGLVKERAKTLGRTVIEDLNDPFNAVTLSAAQLAEDPARLSDEACAISMMGGRRLIRITDAGDKLTTLLKDYLAAPGENALIILEADNLTPRSSLRKLFEKEKAAAAIPCYVEDERDLARFIREACQAENKSIEPDAVQWLAVNISGDRARARSEMEKLLTYKGAETTIISIIDAQSACGAAGEGRLDDLITAAAGYNRAAALESFGKLMEEGVNFIVILRSLQNHFRRLHAASARIAGGDSADSAMKSLSPPVFFKQQPAFRAQLQRWKPQNILKVLDRLMDLEAQCKTTGMPADTLCAQAILSISSMRG